jgi:RNA 3'-terminal phosphate cyclase-like protein
LASSLKFSGAKYLRTAILLSVLTGQPVHIDNIRTKSVDATSVGCTDYEISLLRLVEKISSGCEVHINSTGTSVRFIPGVLIGGSPLPIQFECAPTRSLSYFVEFLSTLCPFFKHAIRITLTGSTNDNTDYSIDTIRTLTIPLLKQFGMESIEITINKRGRTPDGGGEVFFSASPIKQLKPLLLLDEGKIKRIRGMSYTQRCAPSLAARIIEKTRERLNSLIPDVYIYSEHFKGHECGPTASFGISLVAESTVSVLYSVDCCAEPGETPEDVGDKVTKFLFEEIQSGGCLSTSIQPLVFMLMAFTPQHVSRVRIGKLSKSSIDRLRLIHQFTGVKMQLQEDEATKTIVCSCMGVGYENVQRKLA